MADIILTVGATSSTTRVISSPDAIRVLTAIKARMGNPAATNQEAVNYVFNEFVEMVLQRRTRDYEIQLNSDSIQNVTIT